MLKSIADNDYGTLGIKIDESESDWNIRVVPPDRNGNHERILKGLGGIRQKTPSFFYEAARRGSSFHLRSRRRQRSGDRIPLLLQTAGLQDYVVLI
ncbi:putative L,L-diaminopimelate aminotransferase [Leptospira santarosai str. HAI134]|nr:putative L,L-diaminopimelate aminotransferase [Leptospira santarosai str. HAI134]